MSNKPNFRDWNMDCKVYIGNLSETASKMDVENTFGKYGPLRNVWVARNPPGFAFVEYDDARDAEDAVRGLDGTKIGGSRVRVEMSHGRSRRGGHGAPRGYRGGQDRNGGGYSRGRDGGYGDRDRGRRGDSRERFRGNYGRGRSRSPKSRSPIPKRRYSRSGSRTRVVSRSVSRSPVRSPRSPPPRVARTPPSRSASPVGRR